MALSQQELRDLTNAITSAIELGFSNLNGNTNTNNNTPGGSSTGAGTGLNVRDIFESRIKEQMASIERRSRYGKTLFGRTQYKNLEAQLDRIQNGGIGKDDIRRDAASRINTIVNNTVKLGDNITDLIITIQKNQLLISKNLFEKQQKLFQANLQLSQKQTNVALQTITGFTSQLATDAAFAIYKASGEEAAAKVEQMAKTSIALQEYEIAERKRIYEKTQGMTKSIHGIAAGAVAIGLALAPLSAGTSALIGAIAAATLEIGQGIVNWVQKFKKINYEQLEQIKTFYQQEMGNVSQEIDLVKTLVNGFDDVVKNLTDYVRANDTIYKKIGIGFGMTGDMYSSYVRNIAAQVSEIFGTTAEQMEEMSRGYIDASSRAFLFNDNEYNRITATSRLFGMSQGEAASLYGSMNVFNTSIDSASDTMGVMYKQITRLGLSSKKFGKDLVENLKLAQKYNFRGGVENMMKLTKWAQQTRFNLNSAASFADSIMNDSLSGALEKAAKLQVLGGSAAIYSDPLGMLYDAGADVGNMAQRMAAMFNDITGTFNRKTGETEFNWYENRMLAARAQAMGMDVGEVRNMIRQQNKQGVIDSLLRGSGLDKDTRLAIGNRATYVQGKGFMVNTTEGTKTIQQVAKMSADERNRILLPANEEDAIIEIAANTRSLVEIEEANKTTKLNEKQVGLFGDIRNLSNKNIEAQNIIFDYPEFISKAKETLENVGDNAIIQSESTVKFFNENTELIKEYRSFVKNNIDNTKQITSHTKSIVEILSLTNGNNKLNNIIYQAVEAYGSKNVNKREKEMIKLYQGADDFEKAYLRARYPEFTNGTYKIDDGFIDKNGKVTKVNQNDIKVAFKENGPIHKYLSGDETQEINRKQNNSTLIKHELSGTLYLTQDGSTVNLVELLKNNPSAANQFITLLQKSMEINVNGKPTFTNKV